METETLTPTQQAIELKQKGMSLRQIAEALGVSHTTVSNWIKDEMNFYDHDTSPKTTLSQRNQLMALDVEVMRLFRSILIWNGEDIRKKEGDKILMKQPEVYIYLKTLLLERFYECNLDNTLKNNTLVALRSIPGCFELFSTTPDDEFFYKVTIPLKRLEYFTRLATHGILLYIPSKD